MTRPREIDVLFQGVPEAICCHAVDGAIVDPGPASSVQRLVEALGDDAPRAILLTHIHLDHAGAAGVLARRWSDVEVWVHERGAPHLLDPSRLIASATRIYGDAMERLWGPIVPVPPERVRVLEGAAGEREGWAWAYTPGHASHHVSFLRDGVAYVGDVGGVRIGRGPTLAPTPAPDIDLARWRASLDLIAAWEPRALAVAHFGTHDDAAEQIAMLHEALARWAALARRCRAPEFEAALRGELAGQPEEAAYVAAMPPSAMYGGLARALRARGDEPPA
ncbi:MAG TPA: MBL fold metallo-hydrolase [Capillimicrobium sp.]|jgi:glyoxylase-like metal-dependent hydrolase (beta-lactamase superfamily II)